MTTNHRGREAEDTSVGNTGNTVTRGSRNSSNSSVVRTLGGPSLRTPSLGRRASTTYSRSLGSTESGRRPTRYPTPITTRTRSPSARWTFPPSRASPGNTGNGKSLIGTQIVTLVCGTPSHIRLTPRLEVVPRIISRVTSRPRARGTPQPPGVNRRLDHRPPRPRLSTPSSTFETSVRRSTSEGRSRHRRALSPTLLHPALRLISSAIHPLLEDG